MRLLGLAAAGAVVLACTILVVDTVPEPWDLPVLIVGGVCFPLGAGLVVLSEVIPLLRRGSHRIQVAVAAVLGVAETLIGGRMLLGIFGWH
jgi:hypothetical protein